eukprot:6488055-Amphidinium_carterae.1
MSLEAQAFHYPRMFSPNGMCNASVPHRYPDVPRALKVLRANGRHLRSGHSFSRFWQGHKLSNFVVNLGAADGVCGRGGDWNADPANCLAESGSAAVLFEATR